MKVRLHMDATFDVDGEWDIVLDLCTGDDEPTGNSLGAVRLSFQELYDRTIALDPTDKEFTEALREKVASSMRAFADKLDGGK